MMTDMHKDLVITSVHNSEFVTNSNGIKIQLPELTVAAETLDVEQKHHMQQDKRPIRIEK